MTNLEQKIKEQYEIGFPIFQKLFQLDKNSLIKVMKDIFRENNSIMEILENNPRVIKTLHDDEPHEVKICFYDSIEITFFGIRYSPEHGQSELVVKFDKFFNINNCLV